MLGFYENFPEDAHKTVHFTVSASKKRLQQAITQVFRKSNDETFTLEDVATPSIPQCTAFFEFGIAEDNGFNYLDEKEVNRVLKIINRKPFQIMDFFCALRYYKGKNEKKTPLKFDYYILRFTFEKKSTEIQVFHERGPRHVSPKEITDFVANRINKMFSKRILKAFSTG